MENKNNKLSESDFFKILSLQNQIDAIWLKFLGDNDFQLSDDKGSLSAILERASSSLKIILDQFHDDIFQ